MLAEVPQRNDLGNMVARDLGNQDLSAVPRRANSRAAMDIDAHVALGRDGRLACVDPHPDADRTSRERPLRPVRGGDGVSSAPKRGEERVALGVHLDATVTLESVAQDTTVLGQRPRVIILKLLQQTSRALDVREKERDVARRKVTHTLEDYASARICQGSGGADQKAGPS